MRADEFHPWEKQCLRLFHYAALDARHICRQRSITQPWAVLFQPFQQHVGIQGKHDDVKLANIFCLRLCAPMTNESCFFSKGDCLWIRVDRPDFPAVLTKSCSITAADQAKANDQNLFVFIQRHAVSPS